ASREKAKRLVLAGKVRVNGEVVAKPATEVRSEDRIEIEEREPFVSRGGYKLQEALDRFSIDVAGKVAADLGSSTGGFTDCLLQRGACRVYAVDVGKGQLDWSLRTDSRVVVMEGVNARYLTEAELPEQADIVTIDVSFISLEKILPAARKLVKAGGAVVALIKPQFEAERRQIKKGVVKDPAAHQQVVEKVRRCAADEGFTVRGVVDSPILGPAGNKEFLLYLTAEL
ncbi:MAG TPA: TlyA family RNA methyltransferase, partial [bacterium]|nr:TlyA family RNA methyltransferase [bacterium]